MIPGPGLDVGGRTSVLHRLAPEVKVVATLGFTLAMVTVPRRQVWAFAVLAVLLWSVAMLGRVSLGELVRRCLAGAPFLAVAPLLAVVAEGERMAVGALSLSRPGMWAAWNVVVKGLLGLAASAVLLSTTRPAEVVAGLDRLGVPSVFTGTAGFMLRYLHSTVDDARRMRAARLARGDDPRWIWQARGVAATAGTLFVRTYERGERVHRAMLARGYTGRMPTVGQRAAGVGPWVAAGTVPLVATSVALAAWTLER